MKTFEKEQRKSAALLQQSSVTKFTTIAFIVLSFYIMGTICNTVLFGSKDITHIILAILIFLVGTLINLYVYFKTDGTFICYTGMGMYLILLTYLMFYGLNTSTYIYLFPALFLSMMYFRPKYSLGVGIIVSFVNFIDVILLLKADTTTKFTLDTPYAVQIFGIVLCSVLTYAVTRISKKNNDNVLFEAVDEKKKQEEYAKNILAVAEKIKNKIDNSDSIINEMNTSNDVMNSAVKEISMSTANNAESIMHQTMMTQNIQGIIDETNHTANDMTKLASQSIEAIKEGLEAIHIIKNKSNYLEQANQKVSKVMENLEAKMQEVQQITDMISGITNQTNLLALNASIEAARAGEYGKSFGVVAEQIRDLAQGTRNSTESINTLLAELTENTKDAKEASNNVLEITSEETDLIMHAESKFTNIDQVINQLTNLIDETSSKVTDIKQSNNQIIDSITQLAAISEEVKASSDEAYELCSHNAECVAKETNLLKEVDQLIQGFKL
ncbi:methyl-accepting chemotaxis protein [Clostridium sp. Marseille-P299]|uniref:methyl-accepting chemotaxis protein n=1 Tax=Clostridium sp. Marseille-P299 TaxID=1805477 RepID=UPI00082C7CC6|nr:methyl-accepting chemotaxis protein [Clostridium sp. Marseille-P299]